MTAAELLDVVGECAPVCECEPGEGCRDEHRGGVPGCEPQRKVMGAWSILRHQGFGIFPVELSMDAKQARDTGQRDTWDEVFTAWREIWIREGLTDR